MFVAKMPYRHCIAPNIKLAVAQAEPLSCRTGLAGEVRGIRGCGGDELIDHMPTPAPSRTTIVVLFAGMAALSTFSFLILFDARSDIVLGGLAVGIIAALGLTALRAQIGLFSARKQLAQTQVELARVLRIATLDELAASIAHEINQPLSAITTNGQACLHWFDRDVPALDAVRESVQHMVANGARASKLIAGINAMTRRSPPEREPVQINDVIGSALTLAGGAIGRAEILLTLDLEDGIPCIYAGRVELEQVMLNLIMNAVQALSDVETNRRLTVRSKVERALEQIIVEVRDNGPGFEPDESGQLFESFYTTKTDGMGMGLAICRSIISSHGGCIAAISEGMPHGACFVVRLNLNSMKEAI